MSKLLAAARKKKARPEDPLRAAARAETDAEMAAAWKTGDPKRIRAAIKLAEELDEDEGDD